MAFEKFKGVKFTIRTGSAGTLKKGSHRLPHELRYGKKSKAQGGFWDSSLSNSTNTHIEKDTGSLESGVYITGSLFMTMMDNYLSSSLSSGSYQTISASFSNQMGGAVSSMPSGEYIGILSADGAPATASYTLSKVSGIVASNKWLDITLTNTSVLDTASTWSFSPGGNTNELHYTESITSFTHRFVYGEGPITSGALALDGPKSGSQVGIGTLTYINGVDATEGVYQSYLVKGKIFGDGENDSGESGSADFDNTSTTIFLPTREILIHSESIVVSSGSFKYSAVSAIAANSSGVTTTLYYQAGSGNAGPSGSYSGSTGVSSGSHIFSNATLQTPASSGYYSIPGTSDVLAAFRGSTTQDVTGSDVGADIEYQVPRFARKSTV